MKSQVPLVFVAKQSNKAQFSRSTRVSRWQEQQPESSGQVALWQTDRVTAEGCAEQERA